MKVLFATLAVAALVAGSALPAAADEHGHHRGWVRPYPVYVGPAPVYVAPPPVYYAPPPVYYAPRPVVVAPSSFNLVVPLRLR
jgi:hypothetical protein